MRYCAKLGLIVACILFSSHVSYAGYVEVIMALTDVREAVEQGTSVSEGDFGKLTLLAKLQINKAVREDNIGMEFINTANESIEYFTAARNEYLNSLGFSDKPFSPSESYIKGVDDLCALATMVED